MRPIRKIIKKNTKSLTRVAVFIDAANLIYSQKTLGWKIDLHKFMKFFRAKYNVQRANYYYAYIKSDKKQQSFFKKLEMFGYRIKTKEVKVIRQKDGTSFKKGNLDVDLTIDAVKSLDSYSKAIIVSGDSDFASLIKYLQYRKKKVIVISSKGHVARELLMCADKYINLNSLRQEIERK